MRLVGLALIGAVSFIASANAAPIVGDLGTQNPNIIKAAGGCGFRLHPNRWGDCVPNSYGAYRMKARICPRGPVTHSRINSRASISISS